MSLTLKTMNSQKSPRKAPPKVNKHSNEPEMDEEWDFEVSSSEDDHLIGRKRKLKRKKRRSPRKKQKIEYNFDERNKKTIDALTINDIRSTIPSLFPLAQPYDRSLDGETTDATAVEF